MHKIHSLTDDLKLSVEKGQTILDATLAADINHIHHRLIKLGLNHAQTVGIIYVFNIILITYSVLMPNINTSLTFFVLAAIVFSFLGALYLIPIKDKPKEDS